jgi:hypothetical protein
VTRYSYTSLSQLQTLTHDVAGGAHDVHSTYSYNPAGQINSRTTSNDAYVWTGLVNVDRPYSVNGIDLLARIHAIGKLARQMETSDAARPIYRGTDYWRAARA